MSYVNDNFKRYFTVGINIFIARILLYKTMVRFMKTILFDIGIKFPLFDSKLSCNIVKRRFNSSNPLYFEIKFYKLWCFIVSKTI